MFEKLWNKKSEGVADMDPAMVNNRLIKSAFEIANLDIPRMSKKSFCVLMSKFVGRDVSVEEVMATLQYFSGKKGLYIVNAGDVCVVASMLGCSKCTHLISAGWKEQFNRCGLTNFILENNISKASRCEKFKPVYLELG